MRREWQTHCRVITVWWTFIVFRLVETETCCALACCTNANLSHVDIISRCLLSNHNKCLTHFCTTKMFCPELIFILFWQTGCNEGDNRGDDWEDKGHIVLCVTLTIIYVEVIQLLFFYWCQHRMWNQQKRQTSWSCMFNSSLSET